MNINAKVFIHTLISIELDYFENFRSFKKFMFLQNSFHVKWSWLAKGTLPACSWKYFVKNRLNKSCGQWNGRWTSRLPEITLFHSSFRLSMNKIIKLRSEDAKLIVDHFLIKRIFSNVTIREGMVEAVFSWRPSHLFSSAC